jgi:hypothetical protein
MKYDGFTHPNCALYKRMVEKFTRDMKRGKDLPMPTAMALTHRRILVLRLLRVEQEGQEQVAKGFGRLHIDLDRRWPPPLSADEKRYMPFIAPLKPGLAYLFHLLMRRYDRFMMAWKNQFRWLGHTLLTEAVLNSLLPARAPWDGRAPPEEPEIPARK